MDLIHRLEFANYYPISWLHVLTISRVILITICQSFQFSRECQELVRISGERRVRWKKEKEPYIKDQVPGVHEKGVPSFCSILYQYLITKGKVRSLELHENMNVSSSVRAFPNRIGILNETSITYMMQMETWKEGQRDLCRMKMVKNEDKLQWGQGKAWNRPMKLLKNLKGKRGFHLPENDLSCAIRFGPRQCGRPCWAVHWEKRLLPPHRSAPGAQDEENDRPWHLRLLKSTTTVYPTKFLLLSFTF